MIHYIAALCPAVLAYKQLFKTDAGGLQGQQEVATFTLFILPVCVLVPGTVHINTGGGTRPWGEADDMSVKKNTVRNTKPPAGAVISRASSQSTRLESLEFEKDNFR